MSKTPTDTERTGDTRATRNTLNTDTMKWLSGLVSLIGLYIAVSPFIFEATEAATWNDLLTGTAIFLLGGYNFMRMMRNRLGSTGVSSMAALLGLWALISPALIEMGSNELATGTALSGLTVAALSAYNAYANKKADTPERTTTST